MGMYVAKRRMQGECEIFLCCREWNTGPDAGEKYSVLAGRLREMDSTYGRCSSFGRWDGGNHFRGGNETGTWYYHTGNGSGL